MTDRAELRRLAEAATPGPWVCDGDNVYHERLDEPGRHLANVYVSYRSDAIIEANAAYIAAASPDVILSLLDALEQRAGTGVTDANAGSVRVKALEWEIYAGDRQVGEQREYYGFHEFGYYVASKTDDAWSVGTFTNRGKNRVVGFYGTLADAKSAAQDDFDRAVRSALSAKEQGK